MDYVKKEVESYKQGFNKGYLRALEVAIGYCQSDYFIGSDEVEAQLKALKEEFLKIMAGVNDE